MWLKKAIVFGFVFLTIIFSFPSNASKIASDSETCTPGRPNIIFIMADDAGWNDFSFHGSPQIPTPNIDALALSGIVLNNYYGSPLCTPTRGAVMTGKHPIHIRLQHYVVMGSSAEGLPLKEKTLPQYLKDLGYDTHLVGKWHLGHSRRAYLPTSRGFDSHYGYWLGKQDYYDHFSNDGGKWGYDFRSNLSLHFEAMGQYDTDLFTNEAVRLINQHPKEKPMFLMINHIAPHSANTHTPLQAPMETVDKFNKTIADSHRRAYAAMVDKLDESVGAVVDALASSNLLQNSVIVFASDNGGAPEGFDVNYGSNWPLRGVKNTLWEGGTRLSALIWSPLIQNRVSFDLLHAMDWLPTIYEAAGCNASSKFKNSIDGVSLWKTFTEGVPSPRKVLLYNIDDLYNNSAVRRDEWKLIQGNTSTPDLAGGDKKWDGWYGPSGRSDVTVTELLPSIMNSMSGKALQTSGFVLDETKMSQIQKRAEVFCNPTMEERQITCDPYNRPCLFNLEADPCEQRNVADQFPNILTELQTILAEFNQTALTPIPRVKDPNADPKKWGNVWTTWIDNLQEGRNPDFPDICGKGGSGVLKCSYFLTIVLSFLVSDYIFISTFILLVPIQLF